MTVLLLLLLAQPCERVFSPIEQLILVLEEHGIYEEPFPGGFMFIIEEEDSVTRNGCIHRYFDIAIREDHEATGEGDPLTAPVVDRFRVYSDGTISWWSALPGMYIPFEDFLKGITPL